GEGRQPGNERRACAGRILGEDLSAEKVELVRGTGHENLCPFLLLRAIALALRVLLLRAIALALRVCSDRRYRVLRHGAGSRYHHDTCDLGPGDLPDLLLTMHRLPSGGRNGILFG